MYYICSGASIPNKFKEFFKTCFAAFTKANLDNLTSLLDSFKTWQE